MHLERANPRASLIDVLEHVLDKGIVLDAWIGLSVAGVNITSAEMRLIVASIETYLVYADSVSQPATGPPPAADKATPSLPAPARRATQRTARHHRQERK